MTIRHFKTGVGERAGSPGLELLRVQCLLKASNLLKVATFKYAEEPGRLSCHKASTIWKPSFHRTVYKVFPLYDKDFFFVKIVKKRTVCQVHPPPCFLRNTRDLTARGTQILPKAALCRQTILHSSNSPIHLITMQIRSHQVLSFLICRTLHNACSNGRLHKVGDSEGRGQGLGLS